MTEQAAFRLKGRNPDVLTCIANLSNDEVFTPPEFANRMLDTLAEGWAAANGGANIWADSSVTFLDPCTKSGVFLREIATRLINGLEGEFPRLQERVDHILTKQVFGIGITRLTALLARRSLYCSKHAVGPHSVTSAFGDNDDGNIWFERTAHLPDGDRCLVCGAGKVFLKRTAEEENHAYAFIHGNDIKARMREIFGDEMHFDVIIGNPPYQLGDGGGGTSAVPIYQHFVTQAKTLEPRFLTMVIPSRWFTGGKGLDEFREQMLSDGRCRAIDDYLSASDVFPGVGLKGGVSVFLWDREYHGDCEVTTNFRDWPTSVARRPLLEEGAEVFIRFNEGVSILKKVMKTEAAIGVRLSEGHRFDRLVSTRRPFGLESTFRGRSSVRPGDLELFQKGGLAYVARNEIESGANLVSAWKLFVGFAAPGTGNKDTYPHKVISTPFLGKPNQVCTESYLTIGPFKTESQAKNALSYLSCRLPRFLIQLHKASQNTTRKVYTFVPSQNWETKWTDGKLYEKYGLSSDEIAFIESIVRPMNDSDDD
ncbi:restriction endonuclease [Novosphingobium sp. ERN07]|uniref:Eco57I restriction-modification methylase domain-containing protein n=1 Tax=Novosphingobium sp. ERN07 TaxID=2726187 RepID=UPI0014575369|nr:Eco57I restriction-modification methylase domain-containing protein [Novosphingobium sp. ERN07]NLR70777.1 restriction endonuclease [Novosphingobium sp. ERN07]